jgi:hypothetical protein
MDLLRWLIDGSTPGGATYDLMWVWVTFALSAMVAAGYSAIAVNWFFQSKLPARADAAAGGLDVQAEREILHQRVRREHRPALGHAQADQDISHDLWLRQGGGDDRRDPVREVHRGDWRLLGCHPAHACGRRDRA